MKLSNLLTKELILQIDSAPDKWSVLKQMIDTIVKSTFASDLTEETQKSFFDEIKKREMMGTTGVGSEVAFPHARLNGLSRPLIAFACVRNGVDFDAPDNQPAKLVFLFLLPASRAELGVKIYSACSRFLLQAETRKALISAETTDEMFDVIDNSDLEIDSPIIALDLMRPERLTLSPDQPVQDATQLMHRSRTIAAAVVDSDKKVIGEINCNTLLECEIPDYIKLLHSVPHITDFTPFRNYFKQDANLTVRDLMNEGDAVIDENGSLLEVIFMLAVKKHPILYVCRKGILIGVIDPITVMDKIINL